MKKEWKVHFRFYGLGSITLRVEHQMEKSKEYDNATGYYAGVIWGL